MKGVIVQVGEPKSIVLYNSGKIGAIPTPADCHVGMVVMVNYNNKFKVALIALAAVLLVGLGVFIGVSVADGNDAPLPAGAAVVGQADTPDQFITIKQAKTLPDHAFVIVQGKIEGAVGKKRYVLNDGTDSIDVDIEKKLIDEKLWATGLLPGSNDGVIIYGEIDREKNRIVIDAKRVVIK